MCTHHIGWHKYYLKRKAKNPSLVLRSEIFRILYPQYFIGTLEEQKNYFLSHSRACLAVRRNSYEDIGENKPDIICNACLNLECKLSAASRELLPYWQERFEILQIILAEINRTSYSLTNKEGLKKINLYASARAHKLLSKAITTSLG